MPQQHYDWRSGSIEPADRVILIHEGIAAAANHSGVEREANLVAMQKERSRIQPLLVVGSSRLCHDGLASFCSS